MERRAGFIGAYSSRGAESIMMGTARSQAEGMAAETESLNRKFTS